SPDRLRAALDVWLPPQLKYTRRSASRTTASGDRDGIGSYRQANTYSRSVCARVRHARAFATMPRLCNWSYGHRSRWLGLSGSILAARSASSIRAGARRSSARSAMNAAPSTHIRDDKGDPSAYEGSYLVHADALSRAPS